MMDEVVKSVHPEICIGQTDATLCTSHPVLLPPGKPAISISSIITEIPSFLLVQLCAAIEFFFSRGFLIPEKCPFFSTPCGAQERSQSSRTSHDGPADARSTVSELGERAAS